MIFYRSVRRGIIQAVALIWSVTLIIAYLFTRANPGFQTLFIKDIGGNLLTFFAIITVFFLAYENLFWKDSIEKQYFITSRIKNHFHMLCGLFLGNSLTLLASLITNGFIIFIFLRFTHQVWFFELISATWLIFLEMSLLFSLLILFSTFLSRFLASSFALMLYVFANTALFSVLQMLNSTEIPAFIFAFFTAIVPDMNVFATDLILLEQMPSRFSDILTATAYCGFLVLCYLLIGTMIRQRRTQ